VHPIRVALMVAAHPDAQPFWIFAALNHDTWEDTVYTDEERESLKNRIITGVDEDTFNLVIELTNVKYPGLNRKERKKLDWERLSKVSRAAKIIKMFDRIDNLREMVDAPNDFKKLYLFESRSIVEVLKDADNRLANQLKETIEYLEKTVQYVE
jgi:guanosine-3',5'-bis(diphosphate) 3'-pyrophosphohydrolase